MALKQMEELVAQALGQFEVRDVQSYIGWGGWRSARSSVLIGVASAHRGAAFDACPVAN